MGKRFFTGYRGQKAVEIARRCAEAPGYCPSICKANSAQWGEVYNACPLRKGIFKKS